MTDSTYTDVLRTRGFFRMPPVLIDGEARIPEPGPPRFAMMSPLNITHVVDEHGEVWMKSGITDLSDLGFEDISHIARSVMKLLDAVEIDGEVFQFPKLQ